jgi:hypothetical protein
MAPGLQQPQVRSSPVRVTEMAKELTEHFEAGGGNGGVHGAAAGADRGDGGVSASRAASGVALTQHDLVNTANVALVGGGRGGQGAGQGKGGGRGWVGL